MSSRSEIVKDSLMAVAEAAEESSIGSLLRQFSSPRAENYTMQLRKMDEAREGVPKDHSIVDVSTKAVGSKTFRVEEGTKHLDFKQSDTEFATSPFRIGMLNDELKDGSWKRTMKDIDGTQLNLSAAGRALYINHSTLDIFAKQVENGAGDGKYSAIVADDVSGRIPALFAHDRLQRLADLRGTEPPKLYFMAGGFPGVGSESVKSARRLVNLTDRIESEGDGLKYGRALFLTDIIAGGRAAGQFSDAFHKTGIKFDIAAMSSFKEATVRDLIGNDEFNLIGGTTDGYSLYTGGAGSTGALRTATGVEKWGVEATVRKTDFDTQATHQLRQELYELGRYYFEKSH